MRPPSISVLADELGGVVGLHGAAVLDADGVGDGVVVSEAEVGADGGVGGLGVIGGGGEAGADGPDGLVGDGDLAHLIGGDAGEPEAVAELADVDRVGLTGLALFHLLADAEVDLEAGFERGEDLLVAEHVGLTDDVAAFGVTDEDGLDAEVLELGEGRPHR